jgi:hypothetical protein
MAYTNPILGAVQSRQTAQMQNKQFEASLGLQLAQFAENKANTVKDQAYRQSVLGETVRSNQVAESANQAAVDLEAERWKLAKPKRDADLEFTRTSTRGNAATAFAQELENQNTVLASESGMFFQNMINPDGTEKKLTDGPEVAEMFGAVINQPELAKKLLTGADGTQYRFVGAVDLGDGRRAIQIQDPNDPDKVMYMSKNRTAVEGDDLTAMDLKGFDILKSQVSIAMHQAAKRPLSNDLKAISIAMNKINGQEEGEGLVLNNNSVQQAADLSQQVQADQQAKAVQPTATNPAAAPDDQDTKYADNWDSAVTASEKRMDLMREPLAQIDTRIEENAKRLEDVQAKVDGQSGKVPKSLQTQLTTLTKLGQRLADRKAAGNDTFDAAHNNLLDTKEYADGMAPMKNAKIKAKAAANIVKKGKLEARQTKDPVLIAAVEKEVLANPPPIEQVQASLLRPQKMTPALLYQLHVAKSLGMIDDDAIARVADTGMLSADGVTLIDRQMQENAAIARNTQDNQTKLIQEQMKIAGDADKPKYNTTANGTVQALDSKTGNVLWEHKPGADQNDGRSQADIMAVVEQHNDEGANGLDIYESVEALSNNYNVTTMPMLEQNLLSQNLNQVLYKELGVNGFDSPIDWLFGSDEDQATFGPLDSQKFASVNPMQKVTTRFALSADGTITMYDQFGEPHGDRDYKLTDVGNDAVQLALSKILKTPAEVEQNLIPMRIAAMEAELAARQAALGVK